MSWFQNSSLDDYKPETRMAGDRVFRFSLKYGESAKIIFLNDGADVINIRLHKIWGLREHVLEVPCLAPLNRVCPICEVAKEKANKKLMADLVFFFSILDRRGYKKQDGTEVPLAKKIYPASTFVLDKIILPKRQLLKEEYEADFRGCEFRAHRSNEPKGMKPPGTGDSLDFLKRVDLSAEEFKDLQTPFTADELMSLLITDDAEIETIAKDLAAAPVAEKTVNWDKVNN